MSARFALNPRAAIPSAARPSPTVVSYGASLEEARAAAREAIELCVEVYQQEGRKLPPSDGTPNKTIKELVPVKLARA